MFNIIPLKDVLLNLNCSEELYQLFTCNYPRKRSILSNKSEYYRDVELNDYNFFLDHIFIFILTQG